MSASLSHQSYGKSNVRLSHIRRSGDRHEFIQLTVSISLCGEFEAAYTEGDNRLVIPTDTIKNTVYALAKVHGVVSIEWFGNCLARHFNDEFEHVKTAEIRLSQKIWHRIDRDGNAHGHAFIGGDSETNTCKVVASASGTTMISGFDGLQVLKTTESGFEDFLRDKFTTLESTNDRIFATTVTASWPGDDLNANWTEIRSDVRSSILDVFAHGYSPSVQKTLFDMAQSVFGACSTIDEITIEMPNQHHLLVDLSSLGLENANEVFVPVDEPFGMIAATIRRGQPTEDVV